MATAFILLQTLFCTLTQPANFAFNTTFSASTPLQDTTRILDRHPQSDVKGIKSGANHKAGYEVKTIVIDAGHGGHDPGCLGGNSREKHLALAIALKLRDAVQKAHPDVRIIMTRDKDEFIPLYQRAAIANRNEADLFMSIHCNFMPGSAATRGSETYVMGLHTADHNLQVAKRENAAILLEDDYEKNYDYDPNSPEGHIMLSMFQNAYLEQSILFAESIENQLKHRAGLKSRGVKQAGFVVLKETTMPSVLIETGFLSNAREERFLMSAKGQNLVAGAILDAFTEYKTKIESTAYQQMAETLTAPSPPSGNNNSAITEKSQNTSDPTTPQTPKVDSPAPNTSSNKPAPPKVYTNVYQPPADTLDHRRLRAQGPVPRPAEPSKVQTTDRPEERKSASPPPLQAPPRKPASDPPQTEHIQYLVQLVASDRPQKTTEGRWRNTPYIIEVVREDDLFKYRARNFSSLDEAVAAKKYLREHGFPEAFVIAMHEGRRISVAEAQKRQQSNR